MKLKEPVKHLGIVPNFKDIVGRMSSTFDFNDPAYETSELVFNKSLRIVATNEFFQEKQLHSQAERKDELRDLTQPFVDWLKGVYPTCVPVLIQCATLQPGKRLHWHMDCYLYQATSHKIHFPLFTNLHATYDLFHDGAQTPCSFHFEVGHAYEINNIAPHRSINRGQTPRTHVIIDMMEKEVLDSYLFSGVNFHHTHHMEHKAEEVRWRATGLPALW